MSDLRILRGAASGIIAAAVWAAQQPIDKRVFGCSYDDVEMLGSLLVRESDPTAPGLALHLLNGAAFGAAYGVIAPRVPGPAWLKGPTAALLENTLFWPLTPLLERHHPARERIPRLWGSRRALAQATWRHILFGIVLGELDRRLTPVQPPAPVTVIETMYSSNGHGDISHASTPLMLSDPPPGSLPGA